VGEPGGGSLRPYLDIFDHLLPAMRKSGFTEEDITQLMVINPSVAFSLRGK
jgi:predicted metal-dependent phosphotriesterase family hydrolase